MKPYMLSLAPPQKTILPQKSESFFKQLMGYFKREFVMCAGTSSRREGHAIVHHEELGVIQIKIMETHIYCVEEVFEYDCEGKRH